MLIAQVWWESVPLRSKVIGYEVFYSMTAVEDLDQVQCHCHRNCHCHCNFLFQFHNHHDNNDQTQWQRKTVGMTTSIDLLNLERHAQVTVMVMKVPSLSEICLILL